MGTIVVIGGGSIKDLETFHLDKRVVGHTGKKCPKALFIPTASSDSKEYAEAFHEVYGGKLGCETEALYLLSDPPSKKELRKKILDADLIYVGGGNTLKMMKRWRHLGVDQLLKVAYRKGTVLAGISAGGICWFDGRYL